MKLCRFGFSSYLLTLNNFTFFGSISYNNVLSLMTSRLNYVTGHWNRHLFSLSLPPYVPAWWHCITSPLSPWFFLLILQAQGFPGDDLTVVPWQRPRCDEGPLFFFLSSHLPAPLPFFQNLRRTLLPVLRYRLFTWVVPDIGAALQTSAFLPPDGAASHRQHAASEAQLALPEPRRRFCWTPNAWRCSKGLRYLASGHRKPDPGALRRSWRRRDGCRHQHGEPGIWSEWNYRLRPRRRGGSHVSGGGAGFGPSQRAAWTLAGSKRVWLHVGRAGWLLTYKKKRKYPNAAESIDKESENFLSPVLFFSFPFLVDKMRKQTRHWVIEREILEVYSCFSLAFILSTAERKEKACF